MLWDLVAWVRHSSETLFRFFAAWMLVAVIIGSFFCWFRMNVRAKSRMHQMSDDDFYNTHDEDYYNERDWSEFRNMDVSPVMTDSAEVQEKPAA